MNTLWYPQDLNNYVNLIKRDEVLKSVQCTAIKTIFYHSCTWLLTWRLFSSLLFFCKHVVMKSSMAKSTPLMWLHFPLPCNPRPASRVHALHNTSHIHVGANSTLCGITFIKGSTFALIFEKKLIWLKVFVMHSFQMMWQCLRVEIRR